VGRGAVVGEAPTVSIEVVNESDVEVDVDSLAAQARFVLDRLRIHPQAELSVVLVGVEAMTDLHVRWMKEPGPTDVLSFPMDELRQPDDDEEPEPGMLGDVVICPQVAVRQALAAGHERDEELALLLTHGILHLLGYDHAEPDEHAEMFGLQARLLAEWVARRSGAR
jgi:probable rRNA maturation factor